MSRTTPSVLLLPLLCLPALADAQSGSIIEPTWNLRLRHEQIDDDGFVHTARADTLRLRAGLRFAFGDGWSALLEGEGVAAFGDHYNSGANGNTQYPAVIDPEGAELNQAWLGWRNDTVALTMGRQRILLDNQRWVGNVGWRQNEQTFDALAFEWKPTAALALTYDWLDRVHRVSGDRARDGLARERDLDTHLFNVGYKSGAQNLGGYAYLHRDRDVPGASTATYGLRWTGDHIRDGNGWGWTLEAARQRDHGNNPLHFAHDYWLAEPAFTVRNTTFKVGWEHLGGNGKHALQTPLATLHAFDGWADKFAATPAGGLEDRYLSAGGKFGRVKDGKFAWTVAYHDFRADTAAAGSAGYGREWDASLGFPLAKRMQALVKLADYRSDGYARDTRKLWVQLEWASPK